MSALNRSPDVAEIQAAAAQIALRLPAFRPDAAPGVARALLHTLAVLVVRDGYREHVAHGEPLADCVAHEVRRVAAAVDDALRASHAAGGR